MMNDLLLRIQIYQILKNSRAIAIEDIKPNDEDYSYDPPPEKENIYTKIKRDLDKVGKTLDDLMNKLDRTKSEFYESDKQAKAIKKYCI
jgi:Holliday junction resolvase RusA-like endonuclease